MIPNHALSCMNRGKHLWNKEIPAKSDKPKFVQYIHDGFEEVLCLGQQQFSRKHGGWVFGTKRDERGNILPFTKENYPEKLVIKHKWKKVKHYAK